MRAKEFLKTIEFRQARGSLCDQEIMHWVKFCLGLVQLAALYQKDRSRFPVKDWPGSLQPDGFRYRGRIDVFDLIRNMNLGQDELSYWEAKLAYYQMGFPGDKDDRTDNELPPSTPPSSPGGGSGERPGGSNDGSGAGGPSGDNGSKNHDDEPGNSPGGRGGEVVSSEDAWTSVSQAAFNFEFSGQVADNQLGLRSGSNRR